MAPDPAQPRPVVGRRAFCGGLIVGAVVLSGCGEQDGVRPAAAEGDVALVEEIAALLDSTAAQLDDLGERFPSLAAPLTPFADLHRNHLAVLDADREPGSLSPIPARNARRALKRAVRAERDLRSVLVSGADAAESGALALLLASMGAGLTQLGTPKLKGTR